MKAKRNKETNGSIPGSFSFAQRIAAKRTKGESIKTRRRKNTNNNNWNIATISIERNEPPIAFSLFRRRALSIRLLFSLVFYRLFVAVGGGGGDGVVEINQHEENQSLRMRCACHRSVFIGNEGTRFDRFVS